MRAEAVRRSVGTTDMACICMRSAAGGRRDSMLLRCWALIGGRPNLPAAARRVAGVPAGVSPRGMSRQVAANAVLAEHRAEAMRRLFPKLSSWQAPPSFTEQVTRAYDSLSRAVDVDDLKQRVRHLGRNGRTSWAEGDIAAASS